MTAKLGGFSNEHGEQTLLNAVLEFNINNITRLNELIVSDPPSKSKEGPITVVSNDKDGVEFVYANSSSGTGSKQGIGPWEISGDVELTIPKYQSSEGTHSATLIWTLTNAY